MNGLGMAVMNLVREEINVASALYDAITGTASRASAPQGRRALRKHGCEVPPPCWMPRFLGEYASDTSQCSTASIDIIVTNTAMAAQPVSIIVSGPGAAAVQVTPSSLTLPGLHRGSFSLAVSAPKSGINATVVDVVVQIRGCRTYYLYWTVGPGNEGCLPCHHVDVEDGPDLVHHWYDHFYCRRPCPNGGGPH